MPAQPQKARSDNAVIGAAGVYYVAMELSRRGMIALPTIRNTAGFDIIVTSRDGARHANLQVKTSGQRPKFWPICASMDKARTGENDFYVLVRRTKDNDSYEAFMLTGAEARRELQAYADSCTGGNLNFSLCITLDDKKREEWALRWSKWTL
jgi:hypothetical protein